METDDVIRVSIPNLKRAVLGSSNLAKVYVKSNNGKTIKLRKRTASILFIIFTKVGTKKAKNIKKVSFEKDENGLIHYII